MQRQDFSHDWIHPPPTSTPPFPSPALPRLLAPLAPMDTVLNYLIDDSGPVALFLRLYRCSTTPTRPPRLLSPFPRFMAINTQCGVVWGGWERGVRGVHKNPQDLNSGVFLQPFLFPLSGHTNKHKQTLFFSSKSHRGVINE